MTGTERTLPELARWKCESYCLCGSRKGHFERSNAGVWVRYEDVLKLLRELQEHREYHRRIEEYGH